MKIKFRLLLSLLFIIIAFPEVFSQHYVGVRGGYGGGGIRLEPKQETGYLIGFPTGGIGWKYYSPIKYVGAVGAELLYVKMGFKVIPYVDADTSYHRTVESIQLPFMWQPHIYMINRRVRAFLNLGVYVSYNIASEESYVSNTNGTISKEKYKLRIVRDNKFGYGLCGGGGIGVLVKRFEILVEARYNFGYSDLLKYTNKYPGNPKRSPVDHFNISMGLYYRLGKGGILSPPAERKRKMKKEEENEQYIDFGNGNYASAKNIKADTKRH